MFDSVIPSVAGTLPVSTALLCTGVCLALGLLIACVYMLEGDYTKGYVVTLVMIPALVQVVIMMVNGNLGTGIAIVGAFSLVRFRSVPWSSREIGTIFLAMVVGLAAGMGYLTYAAMIAVVVSIFSVVLFRSRFGEMKHQEQHLKILIPEDLDFEGVFEDIFEKYLVSYKMEQVKTTNMGSLYELRFLICMKDETEIKAMMDDIRSRNGNLTVLCNRPVVKKDIV